MKTKATLQVSKINFRRDDLHFTFVECSKTSKPDPFFLTNVKKCIFVTSASAVKKKKKKKAAAEIRPNAYGKTQVDKRCKLIRSQRKTKDCAYL